MSREVSQITEVLNIAAVHTDESFGTGFNVEQRSIKLNKCDRSQTREMNNDLQRQHKNSSLNKVYVHGTYKKRIDSGRRSEL